MDENQIVLTAEENREIRTLKDTVRRLTEELRARESTERYEYEAYKIMWDKHVFDDRVEKTVKNRMRDFENAAARNQLKAFLSGFLFAAGMAFIVIELFL